MGGRKKREKGKDYLKRKRQLKMVEKRGNHKKKENKKQSKKEY